ncbi:MAG: redoxin domain-containing protein, partial [Gammaproteobacteria bacterium]|nr:redoxin domain-containing protein [Gammaproteobacteria bacterium]
QGKKLLLSFYRYASCPFCNLRIHTLGQQAERFRRQGLEMVAVFQSSAEQVKKYAGKEETPFIIIADEQRDLYQLYGVETSWWGFTKAFIIRLPDLVRTCLQGNMPGRMDNELNRMPADFLINEKGHIEIAYFGNDIGDHLPLHDLKQYLSGHKDINVTYNT